MIGLFKKSKKENIIELGLTDNTIGLKDQEVVIKYLLPDEIVEAALFADWGNLLDAKKAALVLTNKRILAIKRGYFLDTTSGYTAIQYNNINSVSFEEPGKWGTPGKIGLDNLLGKISIATQNTVFEVKVYKQYAQEVSQIILNHIQNSSQVLSESHQNIDFVDQLEKLADLKDRGVLSEEEFNVQKRKLLE
jgi:hypothetical protein